MDYELLIPLIYGLFLGSFYNVVGLRVPEGKSIIAPRSSCPNCGHQLQAIELIPVVSYFIQRGKCRQCKVGISPVYPFFELLTGILFAVAYLLLGWSGELFIALTLISLFIIITVSDLAYMIIPDKVLLVFAGIFIVERIFLPLSPWWDSVAGAVAGFLILLFIALISKGGMGGGDIKLFALIGFAVGFKTMILSFFFATFYGAFFGIAAMLLGFVKRKQAIPFGPFIAIGTLTAYFFGEEILGWYLRFFMLGF
ncbi:prepilin peptidase [Mesobacillus selenatarsenatis]|uniref:Leader peptidase (Prepilin peptidase) /N-methyltransferase n=1 Tax=Mesobacillus selenatarsenatis (strain DSM 18680 / JCM 14380 / FERM P-15431 / SF-1) TaxID=1321606 RepID=A0A0A8X1P0_MESS1|nr:A24 family peptidase [Mesobacillus selenatarsenatis]GAM12066.1 leader peptidase (prepilin peptidase) /N-methyltransferase [Mesobacillus selenatarsenatis SF-1]